MNSTRITLLGRLKDLENSHAWQEFDQIYRPMLYRFVYACGVSGAAADDIVQECMTAIVRHIGSFRQKPGGGAFRAWLRKMTVNHVLNFRRKRREVLAATQELQRFSSDDPLPEEILDRIHRDERFRACLERIRTEVEESTYRAFQMHVLDDAPVEDVCRVLRMTPNQVYKIKSRLTRKMAEKMKAQEKKNEAQ